MRIPDSDRAIIAAGAEVLHEGAACLAGAAERLDADFAAAARALAAPESFTMVLGVGKSGYVGRKLAASLLSTGHGAAFVHPTDALHGDLGIAEHATLAVLLSHSGNTDELVRVVPLIKQFGLASVLVTRARGCELARLVDWVLETGVVEEAGFGRLAPTSSSTTTMALCDALMMASAALRGLSPQQFRRYHPGGTLGLRLRRVAELMTPAERLVWLAPGTSIYEVLERISLGGRGFALVGDGAASEALGIITDGDIRRAAHDPVGFAAATAGSIMSRGPKAVPCEALAMEALRLMETHTITALLCVDEAGRVVGAVHIHDVLQRELGLGGAGRSPARG